MCESCNDTGITMIETPFTFPTPCICDCEAGKKIFNMKEDHIAEIEERFLKPVNELCDGPEEYKE